MRYHQTNSEPESHAWGEILPRAMVDLFMLTLLVIIVRAPQFNLQGVQLPQLKADMPANQAMAADSSGNELRLRADGAILWQGETVVLEGLAERMASATAENTPITLVLEITGDKGQGALQAFLRLQQDCSRVGIWNRVRIMAHRLESAG
jgi:biopolymer transport protein ExbD